MGAPITAVSPLSETAWPKRSPAAPSLAVSLICTNVVPGVVDTSPDLGPSPIAFTALI